MAPNSLFAILLRSSWWISVLVAAAIVVLSGIALPPKYFIFGAVGALPFLVIGGIEPGPGGAHGRGGDGNDLEGLLRSAGVGVPA